MVRDVGAGRFGVGALLGSKTKAMLLFSGTRSWVLLCVLALSLAACGDTADPGALGPDGPVNNDDGNNDTNNDENNDDNNDANNDFDGPRLRVATWNVERFFDVVCDSGGCNDESFESIPSVEDFAARADQIAQSIEALDADVVLLQEIENENCIDALKARLGGTYTVFELGEVRQAGSLDTAVLARGELLEVKTHRQNPIDHPVGGTTRFIREFLEVHVEIEGQHVIAFSAHFKSQRNDDPNQRLAEARAARELMLEAADEHSDALVVLGGDLNSAPGEPAIEAMEEGGELQRVAEELALDGWTYSGAGRVQAIDHIYLVQGQGGQFIDGSADVVRDGASYGGSDHSALMADFVVE